MRELAGPKNQGARQDGSSQMARDKAEGYRSRVQELLQGLIGLRETVPEYPGQNLVEAFVSGVASRRRLRDTREMQSEAQTRCNHYLGSGVGEDETDCERGRREKGGAFGWEGERKVAREGRRARTKRARA